VWASFPNGGHAVSLCGRSPLSGSPHLEGHKTLHDPSDMLVAGYGVRRTRGPCGNTQSVAKLRRLNKPGRPQPIARAPKEARATLYAAAGQGRKISFVGYKRSLIDPNVKTMELVAIYTGIARALEV
jgi:hypothetical protein